MERSLLTLQSLESNISQALPLADDLTQCLTFEELPYIITAGYVVNNIALAT